MNILLLKKHWDVNIILKSGKIIETSLLSENVVKLIATWHVRKHKFINVQNTSIEKRRIECINVLDDKYSVSIENVGMKLTIDIELKENKGLF